VYGESVRVQFDKGNSEVVIKARGKNISKAVSVADFVRRNLEGTKIGTIDIGSDKINDKETGKEVYVSSIEIKIVK
jgi:DNA-binding protein